MYFYLKDPFQSSIQRVLSGLFIILTLYRLVLISNKRRVHQVLLILEASLYLWPSSFEFARSSPLSSGRQKQRRLNWLNLVGARIKPFLTGNVTVAHSSSRIQSTVEQNASNLQTLRFICRFFYFTFEIVTHRKTVGIHTVKNHIMVHLQTKTSFYFWGCFNSAHMG